MYPLRSLGSFGIWLFYSFCDFFKTSDLLYYWFQVQATPENLSDHLVNPFVSLNFYSARWKSPLFEKFISLQIPVALGYGEKNILFSSNFSSFIYHEVFEDGMQKCL